MKFGDALPNLKSGVKIAREHWAHKGVFLHYTASGAEVNFITMHLENNTDVPWVPNADDLFSEDWVFPVYCGG